MNTITDFLRAVEDSINSARPKAVVRKNNARRAAGKANKAVDTVFYAAKDESPEDEAKRKKGEISKMLGRDGEEGGITDADMEGAKRAIEYRQRPVKVSGSDVESAIAMREEARTKSPLEKAMDTKPASEKGTGAMLSPKPEGDFLAKVDASPKAKVVAEDELVQSFFAKAHGGSYDPNSRVDKAKMQKILGMVNAQPELLSLTPGKFAVKLYNTK